MNFILLPEEICKKKWAPWFERGGWTVTDLTQKESGQLQISELMAKLQPKLDSEKSEYVKHALLTYLSNLHFPHDGDAHRGRFLFSFDYKYIKNSQYGIFAEKKDYDKYWSWRKPWFYILFYVEDRDKRYMHQVRDPAKYERVLDGAYYNVTKDCFEAEDYKLPVKFPKPTANMSEHESVALIFAVNEWCDNGCKGSIRITPEHLTKAQKLWVEPHPILKVALREISKRRPYGDRR